MLLPSAEEDRAMRWDAELKRYLCGNETPEEIEEMRAEARKKAAGPPPPPPVTAAQPVSATPSFGSRYVVPDCWAGAGAAAPAPQPPASPPAPSPPRPPSASWDALAECAGGGGADGWPGGAAGDAPQPAAPPSPAPGGGEGPPCMDSADSFGWAEQGPLPGGEERRGEQQPPPAGTGATDQRLGDQRPPPAALGLGAMDTSAFAPETGPEPEEGISGESHTDSPGGAVADPENFVQPPVDERRETAAQHGHQDADGELRAELSAARRGWAAAEAALAETRSEVAAWRAEAARLGSELETHRAREAEAVVHQERATEETLKRCSAADAALQACQEEYKDLLSAHRQLERRHARLTHKYSTLRELKESLVRDLGTISALLPPERSVSIPTGFAADPRAEGRGATAGTCSTGRFVEHCAVGAGSCAPTTSAPPPSAPLQRPKHRFTRARAEVRAGVG